MKVDLFSIGHFTVHTYGVMIAIGVILCVVMGYYRAKRMEMKAESVLDLAILCVVMGFLGAKVFFVILSWKQFLTDPLSVLGSSGFVVYGGIIFGVVSALIYCKIKNIRFFEYFDLLAPSVALAPPTLTLSPSLTYDLKPSPFKFTVSSPKCTSTSSPSSDVNPYA